MYLYVNCFNAVSTLPSIIWMGTSFQSKNNFYLLSKRSSCSLCLLSHHSCSQTGQAGRSTTCPGRFSSSARATSSTYRLRHKAGMQLPLQLPFVVLLTKGQPLPNRCLTQCRHRSSSTIGPNHRPRHSRVSSSCSSYAAQAEVTSGA